VADDGDLDEGDEEVDHRRRHVEELLEAVHVAPHFDDLDQLEETDEADRTRRLDELRGRGTGGLRGDDGRDDEVQGETRNNVHGHPAGPHVMLGDATPAQNVSVGFVTVKRRV
jgi:hypothetical protein